MKKPVQHLIAEVPRRQHKVEMTIGTYFVIYRRFEETQGRRF
jgi:hypothetical protein